MDPRLAKIMEGNTDSSSPSIPEDEWLANHPGLSFFNTISGILEIVLNNEPQNLNNLDNLKAPPNSSIESLRLVPTIFDPTDGVHRDLTESEISQIAFNKPSIELFGVSKEIISHTAPNEQHFTVANLLQAIEDTEKSTRENSEWFGGINIHHIALEGISLCQDGTWRICWGS